MRVVHLVSGDLFAGAEAATLALVRALARRRELRASALVLNRGELASRLAAAGIEVTLEPEAGRGFCALACAVRARLADADLVHAHRYKEDVLAALSGRPFVATQHGRPEPFAGAAAVRMGVYGALDRLARRRARALIAVSPEVAEWLAARAGRTPVFVAPNGIDTPAAAAAAAPWPERRRCVGVVARLVPVKDVGLAIDAVAGARGVTLEIVGDGPERAALEARARARGAGDRIRFLGFEPSPPERVAGWRALLVTSHHEGHPIGVLEALAVGTPIVSAPLRGVAEVIDAGVDGRAGWTLPDRDPARWSQALVQIVEDDVAGLAASRLAQRRFAAAFTADAAAERVLAIYRAALGGASPR